MFVRSNPSGFQQQTRSAIPSWENLLYIYGIFQVPSLFAVLVGTNLLIWNASRVNYVFIFGEESRNFASIFNRPR
jgi:xenotropic and polytropic retrovirus receptor 1